MWMMLLPEHSHLIGLSVAIARCCASKQQCIVLRALVTQEQSRIKRDLGIDGQSVRHKAEASKGTSLANNDARSVRVSSIFPWGAQCIQFLTAIQLRIQNVSERRAR